MAFAKLLLETYIHIKALTVQSTIIVGYIWIETVAYAVCAVLIFLWTVEKNLPEDQKTIVARKSGK